MCVCKYAFSKNLDKAAHQLHLLNPAKVRVLCIEYDPFCVCKNMSKVKDGNAYCA